VAGSKPLITASPRLSRPQPETIEIEVDDRCSVEGQQLTDEQSPDDRNAERAAQFGALPKSDRQRQGAEHRRHCRHDDRPEALEAGSIDRIARAQAQSALGIKREIVVTGTRR